MLAVTGQQQSKDITGQQAMPQAIGGGRRRGTGNLAVCLSGCPSKSVSPASEAVESQAAPKRGRGGGARESRHVAEAPPKSRLAGKGGPWSPGKEIEWPLALGARSLAAVLEDAARASHSCCTVQTRLGKPAWGICGARRLLSYEVRPTQCSDGRKP